MHQDQVGRSYTDSGSGKKHGSCHSHGDHKVFCKEAEQYMQVAGRGCGGLGLGFHMKQGGHERDSEDHRDERSRSIYGNAGEWEGEERGGQRHFQEIGGGSGRGEVSVVSHSEGSEADAYCEEDEELEEEEGEQEGVDRGALPHPQMVSLEARQDHPSGLRLPHNFPPARERISKALPSNPLGIFLSSNSLSAVNRFSSQYGAQSGQHGESNGYENGGREIVLRDAVSFREGSGQVANTMNYYTTLLHLPPGVDTHRGDSGNESGCSGEKNAPTPDQNLRVILSDHLSGALMDDATIFPCGHSFGNAGLQRVVQTNSCIICGITVRPESGAPNYALRAAVHAFRREQAQWNMRRSKSAKRKREEHLPPSEQSFMDGGRPKGVQFPYVVNDRVLIKGNKRTPERFFGREAIITTQCLNGWYLVRTLDNGESVRVQYRSLQKIGGSSIPFVA